MTVSIYVKGNNLLFEYIDENAEEHDEELSYEEGGVETEKNKYYNWMQKEFYQKNKDLIKFRTINLFKKNILTESREKMTFIIGEVKENLIFLNKEVFDINFDFCFDSSFTIKFKYLAYKEKGMWTKYISIIQKILKVIKKDIVISDNDSIIEAIPTKEFISFIEKFPSSSELKLYAEKRIEEEIGTFLDIESSYVEKYEKHLNKNKSVESPKKHLVKYEKEKYKSLINELKQLLQNSTLSENEWQKQILEIILLVYPNYIHALSKVSINTEDGRKEIDLCLVKANGCIDIIEIKRPFPIGFISINKYRNNHYPLKELSGAVMQTEKYIFYLNRGGYKLEKDITDRYNKKLKGLNLKIRNPKAIILAGDSSKFTEEQENDFEIVKRKYSSIIDIITYDDLIKRLENVIAFLDLNF